MRIKLYGKVTAVIAAALVLVFTLAVFLPMHASRKGLRQRVAALEREMAQSKSIAEEFAQLEQRVADLQAVLDNEVRQVPASPRMSSLVRAIGNTLEQFEIPDHDSAWQPPVVGADYTMVPGSIKAKADFPAVFGFIKTVETLPQMTQVYDVRLNARPELGDAPVEMQIELCAFSATTQESAP